MNSSLNFHSQICAGFRKMEESKMEYAKAATIDKVSDAVCEYFKITRGELVSSKRTDALADARMIFYRICKEFMPTVTLKALGRYTNRDHSTIIHSLNKFNNKHMQNEHTYRLYNIIKESILGGEDESVIASIDEEARMKKIIKVVCRHFHVSLSDLENINSSHRTKATALYMIVLMATELTYFSREQINVFIGRKRDTYSASFILNSARGKMANDKEFSGTYERLKSEVLDQMPVKHIEEPHAPVEHKRDENYSYNGETKRYGYD